MEKYTYTDSKGKKATVPAGFAVSQIEGEQNIDTGLVIIDVNGNEYVWIPCTLDGANGTLKYQRTEWGVEVDGATPAKKDELTLADESVTYSSADTTNGITAEISKEIVAQINAEKESIKNNGGYYIGRYEVGKEGTVAVVKANMEPYASIKWSKAYSLAKEIGGGSDSTTYLCSSYAWDTAINFIQNNSGKTNYATSIENMNENWPNKEVKDKSGNVIKPSGQSIRLSTGLTTPKCNIYDMGGNVSEFTTELNPGTSESVVLRGGNYDLFDIPAGYRWDGTVGYSSTNRRFACHFVLKVVLTTVTVYA